MSYEEMSDCDLCENALRAMHGNAGFIKKYEDVIFLLKDENKTGIENIIGVMQITWGCVGAIIAKNKINIRFTGGVANAYIPDVCTGTDSNPLRAAMICFLKMKDAQSR